MSYVTKTLQYLTVFDLQNGQFHMIQLNTGVVNTLLPVRVQGSVQSPKPRGGSVSIHHFWCDANVRALHRMARIHKKPFSDSTRVV